MLFSVYFVYIATLFFFLEFKGEAPQPSLKDQE
jgi:hypothetical protein